MQGKDGGWGPYVNAAPEPFDTALVLLALERLPEQEESKAMRQRGRAYLIDHDGYLFASPLTWYPTKNSWDLSPGYEKRNARFTRPITPDCLFCHCNQADHVAGDVKRGDEDSGPDP